MKILWSMVALFLLGCGPHTEVEYHLNTSREDIGLRAGYPALGYASWKYLGFSPYLAVKVNCHVYLMPFDEYPSDACYQAVLAHENRHCYEGSFHPSGPNEGFEPACQEA